MSISAMDAAYDRFTKARSRRDFLAFQLAEALAEGTQVVIDQDLPKYREARQSVMQALDEMDAIEKVQALAAPKK